MISYQQLVVWTTNVGNSVWQELSNVVNNKIIGKTFNFNNSLETKTWNPNNIDSNVLQISETIKQLSGWLPTWNSSSSYSINDVVCYGGNFFISQINNNTNNPPIVDNGTRWKQIINLPIGSYVALQTSIASKCSNIILADNVTSYNLGTNPDLESYLGIVDGSYVINYPIALQSGFNWYIVNSIY